MGTDRTHKKGRRKRKIFVYTFDMIPSAKAANGTNQKQKRHCFVFSEADLDSIHKERRRRGNYMGKGGR